MLLPLVRCRFIVLFVGSGLLLIGCNNGSPDTDLAGPIATPENPDVEGPEPEEPVNESPESAPPPLPSKPVTTPVARFDLSHWKLTLPVNAQGGTSGAPQEIRPDDLSDGYESRWFRRESDGSLVFWAPVHGTTTKNAKYARSELRELINGHDERENWDAWDHSELDARLRVDRVPSSTGKVVVGQIHAFQGEPLVKLRYHYQGAQRSGRLDALVNVRPWSNEPTSFPLASDLDLGEVFSYSIEVDDGVLTMRSDDGRSQRLAIDPAWYDERFYFKLGSYVQARGSSSDDGAAVRFYSFDVAHTP